MVPRIIYKKEVTVGSLTTIIIIKKSPDRFFSDCHELTVSNHNGKEFMYIRYEVEELIKGLEESSIDNILSKFKHEGGTAERMAHLIEGTPFPFYKKFQHRQEHDETYDRDFNKKTRKIGLP